MAQLPCLRLLRIKKPQASFVELCNHSFIEPGWRVCTGAWCLYPLGSAADIFLLEIWPDPSGQHFGVDRSFTSYLWFCGLNGWLCVKNGEQGSDDLPHISGFLGLSAHALAQKSALPETRYAFMKDWKGLTLVDHVGIGCPMAKHMVSVFKTIKNGLWRSILCTCKWDRGFLTYMPPSNSRTLELLTMVMRRTKD